MIRNDKGYGKNRVKKGLFSSIRNRVKEKKVGENFEDTKAFTNFPSPGEGVDLEYDYPVKKEVEDDIEGGIKEDYPQEDAQAPVKSQREDEGEGIKVKSGSNISLEDNFELNFNEAKKRLNKNVSLVSFAICLFFISIMGYMLYFQYYKAPSLKSDAGNRRMVEKRRKVIRGSFYDRNMKLITESKLNSDGSQDRLYHGGEAFGPVLGYVSDIYSVTGLESSLDGELSSDTSIKSFLNIEVLKDLFKGKDNILNVEKTSGHTIVTSLDMDIQNYAYGLFDGKKGALVAIKPKTGEIIAMVSSPGFNPEDIDGIMERVNSDESYNKEGVLINRAIQGVYPPGSTFKVVTLASALQNINGVEDRIFQDKGSLTFKDGSILPNYMEEAFGNITLQEGLAYSSNVVFGQLGLDLSNSQLKKTAEDLGFNKEIDAFGFKAEKSIFPSHSLNDEGLRAQSAIGQGEVAASPLQMALVASAIANEGKVMAPKIVDKIIDVNQVILNEYEPKVLYQGLDTKTANLVKSYMVGNRLSSTYGSLEDIKGGGKTGTAEFMTENGLRVHSWFIGFAPEDNPEIAIAVVMEDLDNSSESLSSKTTLPIGKAVMEMYLNKN